MWLCCDLYTSSDCLKQATKWWIKCVKVKLDKSSDVAGSSAPTSAGWLFFQTRSLASIKGLLVLTESQHVCVFAATKLRFAPFISAGSWFWTCLTLAWILRAFSRQHLSQQSWIRRMGVDPYEYTQYTQTHTLWCTFMLLLCLWAAGVSWGSLQEHWMWVVTTPCRTSSGPVMAGPAESCEQIQWSWGEVSSVGGAKHPSSQSMKDGWELGTKQCCQHHHHLTLTWAHKASYVTEGQCCSITSLLC